jgi:mono/diheme cytochrome c family protein
MLALALLTVFACRPPTSSASDAAPPPPPDPAVVARGEYLVRAVAKCGECHTPRKPDGSRDATMWLAGAPNRFDVEPGDDARGAISAPNLTPDATGLGNWNADDIKRAIADGVDVHGRPLHPLMPSYAFHNMTGDDLDAIVAYVQSLPPIPHAIPERQPLTVPLGRPADPVPDTAIPHTKLSSKDPNHDRAEHGRYLAAQVGMCMDCHTAWQAGSPTPLALDRLFAGGRAFSAADWGVATDGGARVLYSANLTPAADGIKAWTAQQVAKALKEGVDDGDAPLCPPMPAFGELTDADALDIGWYLTTIPPIASGDIPGCRPNGGGGDGGADGDTDAPSDAPAE